MNCPQLKTSIASQAGMKPFGAIREQVTHVVEKVRKYPKLVEQVPILHNGFQFKIITWL